MGELKADGVVHTTEELHAENVRKAGRDRAPAGAGSARRLIGSLDGLHLPRRGGSVPHRVPGVARGTPHRRATRGRLSTWTSTPKPSRSSAPGTGCSPTRDYAAIAWPEEYGGRGASVMEQVVFAEEMHRAGAPGTLNPLGLSNIAPAIIEHGTEEQKRSLLPRMLRGDDIWCQGFSEPDAGSDLASLSTSAVLDGDHFVVNGQKTWNTLGHIANWCELLVRTDSEAPKHRGISCLLVDMTLPGVEVRPLTTITATKEFNELFFTDVLVPTRRAPRAAERGVARRARRRSRTSAAPWRICISDCARRSRGSSTRRSTRRPAAAGWQVTIPCCARSLRRSTSRASC